MAGSLYGAAGPLRAPTTDRHLRGEMPIHRRGREHGATIISYRRTGNLTRRRVRPTPVSAVVNESSARRLSPSPRSNSILRTERARFPGALSRALRDGRCDPRNVRSFFSPPRNCVSSKENCANFLKMRIHRFGSRLAFFSLELTVFHCCYYCAVI